MAEKEPTPEEPEEMRKKEARKDRLHRNYLKRKANGKQKEYEERTKGKKKSQTPQQRKGGYGIMKLSRYEQETIVNYNAGEQTATLYTKDKAVMRKFDTFVANFPDTYKLTGQDEVSKTYSFPKSYISYRKPRLVSTEQRDTGKAMFHRFGR